MAWLDTNSACVRSHTGQYTILIMRMLIIDIEENLFKTQLYGQRVSRVDNYFVPLYIFFYFYFSYAEKKRIKISFSIANIMWLTCLGAIKLRFNFTKIAHFILPLCSCEERERNAKGVDYDDVTRWDMLTEAILNVIWINVWCCEGAVFNLEVQQFSTVCDSLPPRSIISLWCRWDWVR